MVAARLKYTPVVTALYNGIQQLFIGTIDASNEIIYLFIIHHQLLISAILVVMGTIR